jgi:cellulose synthase/poly-beta-1,6-N-acetylglucosamine synthase-like glycosyltransferase
MSQAFSVIVCSRDRPQQLESALPSILAALRPGDELVVVDSASRTDATATIARALGIEPIRVAEPGLARARNAGIAASRNPLVAFTDDDCRPDAGWLSAAARAFSEPHVGAVTGRVRSGRPAGLANSTLDRPDRRVVAGVTDPARLGHGANMAYRRAALESIGRFDERLGAGTPMRSGEDVDAFFRTLEAGWTLVYEPEASVLHDEQRDEETLGLRYGYGLGNGAFRAKVLARDRRLGARLIARSLVFRGVVPMLRASRHGNWVQARRQACWSGGTVVGVLRQLRLMAADPARSRPTSR